MNGVYYLNNRGTRWTHLVNGKKDKIKLLTDSGKEVTRTVQFYSSFGNHATARISWMGKRIDVFPDTVLKENN